MKHYFFLAKKETIREGDEVEMSANYNDPPKWVQASEATIGTKAPDPKYIAHRVYRRELNLENYWNAESSEQRTRIVQELFEIIENEE